MQRAMGAMTAAAQRASRPRALAASSRTSTSTASTHRVGAPGGSADPTAHACGRAPLRGGGARAAKRAQRDRISMHASANPNDLHMAAAKSCPVEMKLNPDIMGKPVVVVQVRMRQADKWGLGLRGCAQGREREAAHWQTAGGSHCLHPLGAALSHRTRQRQPQETPFPRQPPACARPPPSTLPTPSPS